MIDVAKMLIEKLIGAIDPKAILAAKKEHDFNVIGRDLFHLYMSLNEIYVCGCTLTQSIKRDIEWCERKVAGGEADRLLFTDIPEQMQNQLERLITFLNAYGRLNNHVAVLSPEVSKEIAKFVYPKLGIIDKLRRVLAGDVSEHALVDFTEERLVTFEPDMRGISTIIAAPEIPDLSSIPAAKGVILKAWLEQGQPEQRLDTIRHHLEKLHALLIENFTTRELLLNVGDERLKDDSFPYHDLGHRSRHVR
ncbi:hypothetical protein ACXHMN_10945 [Rhizobium sp. LEGMi12c]